MRIPDPVAVAVAFAVVVALWAVVLPVAAHGNHLSADSQVSTDGTLVVESVLPADDAWIVVRGGDDGSPGRVLGHVSTDPDEGLRTDVPVRIEADVWDSWTGAQTTWIVLHSDNGDGEFDPEDDEMLTSFGEPAGDRIQVRNDDAPAYVTAEEFAPQQPGDNSVVVRTAALPTQGHVVVRNATDDGPCDVVGSTALGEGTHRNVTVDLDGEFFRDREGTFSLWAVVYTDGGNGESDDADEPIRVGDGTVSTAFRVEKTDERSPTPHSTTDDGNGTDEHGDHGHDATTTDPDGTPTDDAGADSTGDGPGLGLSVGAFELLLTLLVALVRPRYGTPDTDPDRSTGRLGVPTMIGRLVNAATGGDHPLHDDADEELVLEPDERILFLLSEQDGRMRQQDVVERTDYSSARVSELLAELEDEGRINRYRKDGETVVSFPEFGPS